MRRLLRWTALALGVMAVVWTGLWVAGRGEVAAGLDAQLSAMEARGLAVEHGARRIGGYPFGYEAVVEDVVLEDAGSGLVARLPRLVGASDLAAPGRVTARLPARFEVDLPVPAALRRGMPDLPDTLSLEIESRGLALTVDGAPGRGGRARLSAESVMLIHAGADRPLSFAVEIAELDASLSRPPATGGAPARLSVGAGRVEALGAMVAPEGPRRTLDIRGEGLSLTARADRPGAAMLAAFAPGEGRRPLEAALSGGPVTARMAVEGDPETPDGAVELSAQIVSGVLSLADRALDLRLGADRSRLEVMPAGAGAALAGALDASQIEARYRTPMGPTEEMRPLGLEVSVVRLAPDERLWRRLDPAGQLSREPADLTLHLDGTGRLTKPPAARRPGEAFPLEIGNLEIRAAKLSGLGARATAEGQVEFVQPVARPHGRVELRLDGALGLLRGLQEAGLIDEQALQLAAITLSTYTRAGRGRDTLLADISMDMDGIRVNGERVR